VSVKNNHQLSILINESTALGMHSVLLPKDLVGSSLICRLNFFLNIDINFVYNNVHVCEILDHDVSVKNNHQWILFGHIFI
jgi:hypothetical protein